MIIAILLTSGALVALAWLVFNLAVHALPFFVGVSAASWAHAHGSGPVGAGIVGLVAGILVFALGKSAITATCSPALRLLGLAVYLVPAAVAGSADRTIASRVGADGLYRPDQHLAEARRDARPGDDPEGYVGAHVRRLKALRRAGVVERLGDGAWRVPANFLDRAATFEAQRSAARLSNCARISMSAAKPERSARPGSIAR